MLENKMGKRQYFKCVDCGKPYSIKAGTPVRYGMGAYCRQCAPAFWPSITRPKKAT